jgi:hypothetical protein
VNLPGEAARIGAEVFLQLFSLRQDGARVLQQRAPGLRRRHAGATAHQKLGAERQFHLADARRGRSEREVGALGAVGDASRLDDVAEQIEIGEVDAHGLPSYLAKAGYIKHILHRNYLRLKLRFC